MSEVDLTPPSTKPDAKTKGAKTAKGEKAKKEPKVRRSAFASIYPEDAPITVLAEKNPKKEGSKARERFEHYFKSKTVGDFLAAGGTYADIAYDVGRAHIKVG
jgi:hypothetical protein